MKTFVACCALLIAGTAQAQMRLIPHVTAPGGDFATRIYLTNTGEGTVAYILTGYTQTGGRLPATYAELDPNEAVEVSPGGLFPDADVSHFVIDEGDGLDVTVSYRDAEGAYSQAHVRESSDTAYRWRIYPGALADVTDGIAVVNTDPAAIHVKARQLSADGEVLNQVDLFGAGLASMNKGLYVFTEDFQRVAGASYEVYADAPFALLALRFANGTDKYFWQTAATPMTRLPSEEASVGQVAVLDSLFHGVSGTVKILNTRTLRFENFNYDGGGLIVKVYLGKQPDFSDGRAIGDDLVRNTPYINETFDLTLPASMDLSDFNRVAIWCITANANFGSGPFEDP